MNDGLTSADLMVDYLRLVLGDGLVTLDTFKPDATISLRLLLRSLGHTDDPDPESTDWTQAELAERYTADGDTITLPEVLLVLTHIRAERIRQELRAPHNAFCVAICRLPFMQQAAMKFFENLGKD